MSTVVSKNVQIGADGTASNNFTIYQPESPDGTLRIGNGNSGTTSAQVVLTSAGNVGIGTSSPDARLHTTMTGAGGMIVQRTNNVANANIEYRTTSGSVWAGAGLSQTFAIGSGADLTGTNAFATFDSLLIALRTSGLERARITSDGDLLIGTTTTAISGATGGSGFVSGTNSRRFLRLATTTSGANNLIEFYNANGLVGSISTSASATTYATSSDYRLKHDIQPMTGALAKVAALKPVTYKWNADDSDGEGFIAHELAEVVPGCVTGQKDAVDAEGNPQYQGIDTSFLVATLTAAIQEQQAIITALTARVEALEAKP
jgi:hypothetical protein